MENEDIRAMDGPALTRLAWELGLAPDWVRWDASWLGQGILYPCNINRHGIIEASSHPWTPDRDLVQADDVFRQLRARGWRTRCTWSIDDCRAGEAWASKADRQAVSAPWREDTQAAMARAMLLVSVLAAASEGGPHDAQR